jgi:hypothetical protein
MAEEFVTALKGAAIAKVYDDFLRMENVWNPYGLRIASKVVRI